MSGSELGYMPASLLAPMIRARKLSPVELLDAVLGRIARLEPRINAFAVLDADRAMTAARAAKDALMGSEPLGPLHGIPVTIKDLAWTKRFPTQFGSQITKGNRVPADTPIVSRLEAAGAIVLGKTTTSEFGWTGVSRSPLTGITHNPWRHGFNAGASSAGAGAAAAAGFGPLHQGSDGAGSVRMPAHFCGIYGLKPSFGRVPYAPVNPGDYTSHIGPMTRTVEDAALMMAVMSGPDPADHTTLESAPADYVGHVNDGIGKRRLCFSPDLGHARVDPEIADIVRQAAERFARALGTGLYEVEPEWGPLGPDLARAFWPAHMTKLARHLPEWESRMDPGLVACIREGERMTIARYQEVRERKMAYIAEIQEFFEDWDFLITPAVSVAAFPAERLQPAHWPEHAWDWLSWAEFSYPFNMSWNPSASIPCGFTADGLPVGMQITGRRFDDLGVLQASRAFERVLPWAGKPPALD
ncbi:MAG: amidase [Rhodospirillales bacterium]|nr:amidase [Rhodospirillales bacterium]